jgi:hypothetical protein
VGHHYHYTLMIGGAVHWPKAHFVFKHAADADDADNTPVWPNWAAGVLSGVSSRRRNIQPRSAVVEVCQRISQLPIIDML